MIRLRPRFRQLHAPNVRNATGLAPAGTASMGTERSASVGAPIRAATAVSVPAIEAEHSHRVLAEHGGGLVWRDRVEGVAEREVGDRHRRRRRRCTARCSRCGGSRSPTSAVTRTPRETACSASNGARKLAPTNTFVAQYSLGRPRHLLAERGVEAHLGEPRGVELLHRRGPPVAG